MNKKTLYHWHKRLGLTLGFILFVLGTSGVILTFRDELLPKVYPELMRVEPSGQRAPLTEQIKSAKAFLDQQSFTHLYTAERDDTSSMFFFRPQGSLLPHLLAIDPYTSEIKGTMPLVKNIFGLMLYLHANLLMGKVGSWVVGLMGLLLTGFFISGIILFWPRQDWMKKIKQLPKSGVRGLHRGLGLFLGLPLVFSALTGFVLAFDLLSVFGPKKPPEAVVTKTCTLEEQMDSLKLLSAAQQDNLVSIHFCTPKNGLMKMSYGLHERSGHDGYERIVVDPREKKILQTFNTFKDPSTWSANTLFIYPLHTGEYFGFFGRVLIFILGIALSGLYLTGIWPHLSKRLAMRKFFNIKKVS